MKIFHRTYQGELIKPGFNWYNTDWDWRLIIRFTRLQIYIRWRKQLKPKLILHLEEI